MDIRLSAPGLFLYLKDGLFGGRCAALEILEEETRRRAHELWENEGRPEGRDLEFWLRAERELHRGGP
ncbi:DUF2934 domain-containing protein [Bradyrhizobium sp. BR 1432]|uniref:DUF2934 domain-containing protein n=1 Tax=Bradyrhizobium sp. BR 1432 TaxID=3447966 RepID=UPI003EE65765